MAPHDTTTPDTLLSVSEAATTLGLHPATVEQYIHKGQLAAVRLPHGHATRLFVAHTEIDRYRHASLGSHPNIRGRTPGGHPVRRARAGHMSVEPHAARGLHTSGRHAPLAKGHPVQFYSLQTKETLEVPDDQVERTTMANGRPAARATIDRDGKTLKLFKFLPADAATPTATTTTPPAVPAAPKAKKGKK